MSIKRFLLIGNQAQSLVNFRGVLLNDIQKLGYETHAAVPDFDLYPEAKKFLHDKGILTHRTKFSRAGLNPLADLWACLHLFLLMRDLRPDIMLSYTVKPVIWGSLAGYLAQVPHRFALITGLGYAFAGNMRGKRRFIAQIVRGLYRLALTRVNTVFFQNPDDEFLFKQKEIIPNHISSCVVNGSGVDLQYFSPAPLPKGAMRFLMIARLLGDKGVREYVTAAKIIRKQYPTTEFHLVGGLDYHNPDCIKDKEMEAWQEEGNIIWHGEIKDVRPYIANCHVFVLPSYREGTPRSVLEAMAMGRAIITTDAPGCRETVIEGKNGFLVSIADAATLAKRIKLFLTNDSFVQSFGLASQELAKERYDIKSVNLSMLSAMRIVKK